MPEPLYQLNLKGKRELKRLLEAAKCSKRRSQGQEIWNRSWLETKTKLTRDTVEKIVKAIDPSARPSAQGFPVQQRSLVQLFQKLGATQPKIEECSFWEEVENTSDSIAKRPEQMAKLLRTLDYAEQQPVFDQSLRDSSGAAAFLIPTPCVRTQRWVIDRLAYSINNVDRALRTPLINVEKHPIRADGVNAIWCELAKKLKIVGGNQSNREAVLRKLCQTTQSRPVIIALYNFGEEDLTPQDVIEDFWLPLLEELSTSARRSARSRIVMLIADRNLPSCDADSVTMLPQLNAIAQSDVEEWLQRSNDVYPWCRDEFGQGWVDKLIQNEISGGEWKWDKPGKVLDQLCFSFGLGNGVTDLQRKWEWS